MKILFLGASAVKILIYYQINTKYTFYMLYQYLYKLRYWRLLNKFSYSE